jgi:uncharacterized protein (DUF2249 family)
VADRELDVRALRKPDKHPAVFRAYDALAVGGTLVLVNDHDPGRLRERRKALTLTSAPAAAVTAP